jgi:hypothetical protein
MASLRPLEVGTPTWSGWPTPLIDPGQIQFAELVPRLDKRQVCLQATIRLHGVLHKLARGQLYVQRYQQVILCNEYMCFL